MGDTAGELTAGTGTGTGTGMTAAGGLAAARETKRARPRGIEAWYLMMCGWGISVEESKKAHKNWVEGIKSVGCLATKKVNGWRSEEGESKSEKRVGYPAPLKKRMTTNSNTPSKTSGG